MYLLDQAKSISWLRQGLVRRLLDRADGVSRKALREAVFYVVGPHHIVPLMCSFSARTIFLRAVLCIHATFVMQPSHLLR